MKSKFISIPVLLIIFLIAGCGQKDQQTQGDNTNVQKTEQQQNTGSNPPGTNTENKTNELGIKDGMPADYPSDIPVPANSKQLGSLNTSEGSVVTFESTDKPKDVLAAFAEAVEKSGFKKSEGDMMSDDGGMTAWTKEKREVSIMLAWDKDKKVSSVVVTYR